jgi:predicted O-linked N-acetylglucosamine transferase (SPINDLY family)
VFFDHHAVEEISRRVERRICAAFLERGLDPKRHVCFLKPMRATAFNRVLDLSDIYLDNIGWNGCITTVDALCRDLPVVTLTGPVARSRMGMAFLRHLGIAETVAGSADEYVETAVRLAADPAWRQTLRNRIAAAKSRLFDDAARVQGLASFLEAAVRAPASLAASH